MKVMKLLEESWQSYYRKDEPLYAQNEQSDVIGELIPLNCKLSVDSSTRKYVTRTCDLSRENADNLYSEIYNVAIGTDWLTAASLESIQFQVERVAIPLTSVGVLIYLPRAISEGPEFQMSRDLKLFISRLDADKKMRDRYELVKRLKSSLKEGDPTQYDFEAAINQTAIIGNAASRWYDKTYPFRLLETRRYHKTHQIAFKFKLREPLPFESGNNSSGDSNQNFVNHDEIGGMVWPIWSIYVMVSVAVLVVAVGIGIATTYYLLNKKHNNKRSNVLDPNSSATELPVLAQQVNGGTMASSDSSASLSSSSSDPKEK